MHATRWRESFMLVLMVLVAIAFAQNNYQVGLLRKRADSDSITSSSDSTTSSGTNTSSGTSSPSTSSSPSSTTDTTTTTSSTPTSTSSSPTSSTPTSTSTTSETHSTSTSKSTSSHSTSSAPKTTSSSTKVSKKTTVTKPLIGKTTVKTKHTITTAVNGHKTTKVIETSKVVSATTGYATSTLSPSLSGGGESTDNAGLSNTAKKVIGGIVGTIGGIILIGGIAIVVWRIYGRKRHYNDMDDADMVSSDSSLRKEKRRASGLPFASGNLEQYHAPSARVNVGSNF